jgi:hypothetical protein
MGALALFEFEDTTRREPLRFCAMEILQSMLSSWKQNSLPYTRHFIPLLDSSKLVNDRVVTSSINDLDF